MVTALIVAGLAFLLLKGQSPTVETKPPQGKTPDQLAAEQAAKAAADALKTTDTVVKTTTALVTATGGLLAGFSKLGLGTTAATTAGATGATKGAVAGVGTAIAGEGSAAGAAGASAFVGTSAAGVGFTVGFYLLPVLYLISKSLADAFYDAEFETEDESAVNAYKTYMALIWNTWYCAGQSTGQGESEEVSRARADAAVRHYTIRDYVDWMYHLPRGVMVRDAEQLKWGRNNGKCWGRIYYPGTTVNGLHPLNTIATGAIALGSYDAPEIVDYKTWPSAGSVTWQNDGGQDLSGFEQYIVSHPEIDLAVREAMGIA